MNGGLVRWIRVAFDNPWAVYPFAAVLAAVVVNTVVDAVDVHQWSLIVGWWILGTWLALALLWHLVVAPIPDRTRERAIRREVPEAEIVCAARGNRAMWLWIAQQLRERRARRYAWGIAAVATAAEFQIWMGPATDSSPVATIAWKDVVSISPGGRSGSAVRFVLGRANYAIDMRFIDGRQVIRGFARGRDRSNLIEQLNKLRATAAG